ncbi:helix-turn-helix domain-containing protein [Candidatus Roizmanbacteria bacterium]|nr:helix-turn-helix domain-containing protein [Candidatus Roizmanbacteria bacterium]
MNNLNLDELSKKLDEIKGLILSEKDILNMDDLSVYTGFSKDYLYKLTSGKSIPYYKPEGKMIFFKKTEVDAWLLRNRHATVEEIDMQAATYIKNKGRRKVS